MGKFLKWILGMFMVVLILTFIVNSIVISIGYGIICMLSPLEFEWSTMVIISTIVTLIQTLILSKK